MKRQTDQPSLPFEEEAPHPPVVTESMSMFGITAADLEPIRVAALKHDQDTDFSKMGSWGILFLICGAMAGESQSWKATVFENIRIPDIARSIQLMTGGPPDNEHWGMVFSGLVKTWNESKGGQSLARRRLKLMPEKSEKTRQIAQHYFGLAIMLNSLTDFESDEFSPVKRWAERPTQGWQTLFFASGLLLSSENTVRWEKMRSVILSGSEEHREDVEALLARYSSAR